MTDFDNNNTDFQTPPIVAEYMASLLPNDCGTILEPTPGAGNLVKAAQKKGRVTAPASFEQINPSAYRFDYVIMNPPFSPMKRGYWFLTECMRMSNNIIALLPWFIIINSETRLKEIQNFGIVSITHLPRKTFPGTRIQCCILQLKKEYKENTIFKTFDW